MTKRMLLALVSWGPLVGCASLSLRPPGSTGFERVATLDDLGGLYRNAGEVAEGQPTVYLSSLIWSEVPGLDHRTIERIEVTVADGSHLEVSAWRGEALVRQDVFVEGEDFEFRSGRLRTQDSVSRGEGPLAGVQRTTIEFGLDEEGHGKFQSKVTAAGLVYMVLPVVAGEANEVRFVRIDLGPSRREQGAVRRDQEFPPAGTVALLSTGWVIPTGSVSNIADTVHFEETDAHGIYGQSVAISLGIAGWFYGMYVEGAMETRWDSNFTDRGQQLADSWRDDGQSVDGTVTSFEVTLGRYLTLGDRTMVFGGVAAGSAGASLSADDGEDLQRASGFAMAARLGLLRRWGHSRFWWRPSARYPFLSSGVEIPHDLSFQVGLGYGLFESN